MLTIKNLTIYHQKDLRELVHDLSFTVSGKDRLAVIGEEGNGKSTLLKLIYAPDSALQYCSCTGAIASPGERLGYLPQEIPAEERGLPVYAFCAQKEAFLEADPREISGLCARLRLPADVCYADQPVYSLSGGEKVKLQLLLLLCGKPSMLLLDEPSNDLDLPSLRFLEDFIVSCGLPVVYISHDETLLSRTATRVLHLELAHYKKEPRWTLANVPYARYMAERAQALKKQEAAAQMERREIRAQQARFQRIQQSVEHAQNDISRQDPSGGRLLKKKMQAVKSLERRFERERENQTQRPNIEYAMDASFAGDHSMPPGKRVLEAHLPALRLENRVLAENIHLDMIGPEKVLLVGENGCGKTTLLRHIAEANLGRADIRAAFMPQRYEEQLPGEKTPIQYLHTRGDKEQLTQLRAYLGAFKFTREEMEHPIQTLSGGQKAKLLWLRIILSDANLLLLDEPTRNLSPLSAPVVRGLMCGFEGAILSVTHDRTLIGMWPGRVLRLCKNGMEPLSRAEIEAL
ncbi:MAG: ABC-F family ATP-binding cassette domain-containing protein [Clostridia bacterium]|nr:ABC-F family ATP-binding cassette domain-containing protein [Clostridia bacterium]